MVINHRSKNGNLSPTKRSQLQETAHDWEEEKRNKDFYDDGTMSYFWRAHTLTVLVIFSCVLVYVALLEQPSDDHEFNTKRGIVACILAFLLFGVTQTPDGPFKRPHPAFWRLTLCLSIVYELFLVFLLFQTVDDSRQLMKYFDEELGKPLPEKDYGGNCHLYDYDNPADPFHNIWDKMDGFVPTHFFGWLLKDKTDIFVPSHFAGWFFKDKLDGFVPCHFFGWWLKTLILRDYWLCTVLSIMFEVLEYTLEHQLPNFSECWWDHWIMDALVCNGLGIYFGMLTIHYLSIKSYHWRGIWNCRTYKEKLKRVAEQFTPYSWTDFDWRPTESLNRWLGMLMVIMIFLLAELNTFYLKFALWIPPPHFLCLGRLVFFLFWGAVAMRETFQYMDDPTSKEFGRQSWIIAVIIITELLIIIRFDYETVTKPLPSHMLYFWILAVVGLALYTLWNFYFRNHPLWFLRIEIAFCTVATKFAKITHIIDDSSAISDICQTNKVNGKMSVKEISEIFNQQSEKIAFGNTDATVYTTRARARKTKLTMSH